MRIWASPVLRTYRCCPLRKSSAVYREHQFRCINARAQSFCGCITCQVPADENEPRTRISMIYYYYYRINSAIAQVIERCDGGHFRGDALLSCNQHRAVGTACQLAKCQGTTLLAATSPFSNGPRKALVQNHCPLSSCCQRRRCSSPASVRCVQGACRFQQQSVPEC